MTDERTQRALKFQAQRQMRARQAIRRLSDKMIDRHSVVDDRMRVLYEALQIWNEPISAKDLRELLGWSDTEWGSGDLSPLNRLVWEGKVGVIAYSRVRRLYYADPDLSGSLIERSTHKDT